VSLSCFIFISAENGATACNGESDAFVKCKCCCHNCQTYLVIVWNVHKKLSISCWDGTQLVPRILSSFKNCNCYFDFLFLNWLKLYTGVPFLTVTFCYLRYSKDVLHDIRNIFKLYNSHYEYCFIHQIIEIYILP
jgi:hypothetical protein